jgi:hypothetical protein
MPNRRQPTGNPVFDAAWDSFGPGDVKVGRQRMEEWFQRCGDLQANFTFMMMSIGVARSAGYSDEYIAALKQDADDVVEAAALLQDFVREMANDWKAQREEVETE